MDILRTKDKGFKARLSEITKRGEEDTSRVEAVVREILDNIKKRGDGALKEYTKKFDNVVIKGSIEVSRREINAALKKISKKDLEILKLSAERIKDFHSRQLQNSWFTTEADGTLLGQRVTPMTRVGIYVPGGKASYPSTVLMNAVPAKVAGVKEVIMVTPPGKDGIDPYVLAAADVAGSR